MALEIHKNAQTGRSIHERQQRKRTIQRIIVSVSILLILFVGGAIAYVWYMGQHPVQIEQKKIDTTPNAPVLKANQMPADAVVGIVQQTFSATVTQGSNASLSIKTNPKAACQISVKVNNTVLPDTGLVPKVADEFGIVNWSWTVPKNVLIGTWPVEVTCANEKKSAYFRAMLEVTR